MVVVETKFQIIEMKMHETALTQFVDGLNAINGRQN